MNTLARLARHTTNYSLVSVLATVAGLISFPILTRLLSVEEYGLMSLIGLLLSLVVAFAKLGLQHSTVRFFSEAASGRAAFDVRSYAATTVLGMAATGVAATVLWTVAAALTPAGWWPDPRIGPLVLFTSVLVLIRVMESAWVNQLRAEEHSGALAVYSVAKRYAVLVAVLGALVFVARDLWGLYGAMILTEAAAAAALGAWMLGRARLDPRRFSWGLFKAMAAFGAPMIGTEVAALLLSMGDRYVIQHVMGAEALGVYAASYNLCEYIKAVLFVSIAAAGLPMYLRIWEDEGACATRAFLEKFFRVYALIALPAVVGVAAVADELIAVLASSKYREGAELMRFLMLGMAFEAAVVACSAGLYVMKRSRTILALGAVAAAVNIGLNVLLVPRFGLPGAAWATLISFAGLALASYLAGSRLLPITFPLGATAKFGLAALTMYGAVASIELQSDAATLAVRAALGAAVYCAAVVLLDAPTREAGRGVLRRLLQRGASA